MTYYIVAVISFMLGYFTCALMVISKETKKMDMDDLIDQFVGDLEFDVLVIWADILGVEHDENMWLDDMWPDSESELRVEVGDAMRKVGVKNK